MIHVESHGCTYLQGQNHFCSHHHEHERGDRFGRLFPALPPLFTDPRILAGMGALTGPMDGGTAPDETDTVAVGKVFFAQFVDHDITLDVSSSFSRVNEPGGLSNARTPTLDLDCIYGGGPEASPHLYHDGSYENGDFRGVKLITGAEVGDGAFAADDLPRAGNVALIGDPRNDENRIVSQIQLAMLRFHNRLATEKKADYPLDTQRGELFEEVRKTVTWHYQWCIVHDLLTSMCGAPVVERVLGSGRHWYTPHEAYIPVEFSVAAYRFGHSMVPMSVQAQQGRPRFELFGDKFGLGFTPVSDADAVCDMHELFETDEGRQVQKAVQLNSLLATDLLQLSTNIVDTGNASLPTRNLIRGQSFLLPSGENVAAHMGIDDALIAQVSNAARAEVPELTAGTPLWYYILMEAQIIGRANNAGGTDPGEGLGPVGAQIVAETIIGLIELDDRSWLGAGRNWRPVHTVNNDEVEIATIGHMLTYV